MSRLIRFFTKILDICKLVPMLPVVVIAAIPLALLGDWRPWGNAMAIPVLGNPGFGQWLVIALVLVIVIDTVRGMIDDLRHGQVGVDVLAVVAILSTVAVAEYWASWAVTLMITSGEAIEEYAQAKAERSLTALMEAAPQPRTSSTCLAWGVGLLPIRAIRPMASGVWARHRLPPPRTASTRCRSSRCSWATYSWCCRAKLCRLTASCCPARPRST